MKTVNVTFEITNEELFNEKVIDVDVNDLLKYENCFRGSISIETEEGVRDFTGEFGSHDYEEEFGFTIICE